MLFEIAEDKQSAFLPINCLANICGYFYNAYLKKGVTANNGYNCNHPEQEEVQDGCGCCNAWSCPLGYEADKTDCEKFGYDHYEGEYIITDDEVILNRLISSRR